MHHALVEIEVIEGHLECPESGRQFPIKNGIPNMLLNEDEVWLYLWMHFRAILEFGKIWNFFEIFGIFSDLKKNGRNRQK